MTINYDTYVNSDMGHLITDIKLPINIKNFVTSKIKMYVMLTTDKETKSAQYYVLKQHMKKKWKYFYDNNTTVTITYNTHDFDPNKMITSRSHFILIQIHINLNNNH